jgi:hypothetical protein
MTRRFLLVAVLTLAGVFTLPPARAQDGIPVGKRFLVPIQVGTKIVNGRAIVGADKVLVILYPSADGLSIEEVAYTLSRVDVPVPPGPTPGPIPQPQPKPKAVAVFLIYESQDRATNTPAFAAVKQDKAWRAYADSVGMPQHVWDKDDPRLQKLSGVLATANAKGLPCVVVAFSDGTGKAESVPKDPAGMLALVKKYGGG